MALKDTFSSMVEQVKMRFGQSTVGSVSSRRNADRDRDDAPNPRDAQPLDNSSQSPSDN